MPIAHRYADRRKKKGNLTDKFLDTTLQERQQLRYELDLNSWNLRIWGVAASGFLTDSFVYSCFVLLLMSISYWAPFCGPEAAP